jgi:hypothetical protein
MESPFSQLDVISKQKEFIFYGNSNYIFKGTSVQSILLREYSFFR